MATKFRPLNDRILVKRSTELEKTAGGILIPEEAREAPAQGEVLAVGPGSSAVDGNRRPLDVKVGDVILFGKYSGVEIKIDGEAFLIMKEEDVLGCADKT